MKVNRQLVTNFMTYIAVRLQSILQKIAISDEFLILACRVRDAQRKSAGNFGIHCIGLLVVVF